VARRRDGGAAVTAEKVADYSRDRAGQTSRLGRTVSPATRNRELATLRHALRLAHEWGYVEKVPRIRMAREPDGRLRFLSEDEAVRLLDACRRSQSRHLAVVVTVALYTGMRAARSWGSSGSASTSRAACTWSRPRRPAAGARCR